jgi:hypothetical protein
LDRWKQKYPEFRCALKAAKDAFDDRVERSLYERAVGWGNLPPDVTACIFWLKNRRKAQWRDVQNVEAALGHYVISEHPLTEQEWIEQHTKNIGTRLQEQGKDSQAIDTLRSTSQTCYLSAE